MEADIVVEDPPRHDSHGRNQRRLDAFIARHSAKISHRDERIAKATAKRVRRNAKRVRDAIRSELGQRLSRELRFGEPFCSIGLVDAVIIEPADAALKPSDDQFASWALIDSDGLGGYASVDIDPATGIRMMSRYKGGIYAKIESGFVTRRPADDVGGFVMTCDRGPELLTETPFRVSR